MQELLNNTKKELESTLARLVADISVIHSARANPALVENILVPAYGNKMPLRELASFSVPDARTIIVQPWDVSMLPEIQNAFVSSNFGFGVTVDEKFVRLTLPQLSEERRDEILKILGRKVEDTRIGVRRVRDHAMKSLEDMEKSKVISQDMKFRTRDGVQKLIDDFNKKILAAEEKKAQEISG
ncbi:MAG: ribosome-recycling factor [Patescibacteria group bacterium]|mgnify:CR=1 FL=1